jgi:hypothetical protein
MRRIALTGLVVLAAGCGGSSHGAQPPGALGFAYCMRANGVPHWPDPDSSGVFDKTKLTAQALGAGTTQVRSAMSACRHLLPGGAVPNQTRVEQVKAEGLRFAQCVRAHGVANFPDPGSDGRIPDPGTAGIDQGSPLFQAANQACGRYRPPYMPSNAAYNSWARAHR